MIGAKEYGEALFSLTEELGTTETVAQDLRAAVAAIGENADYIKLLDTPALPAEEKLALAEEAFRAVDESLRSLILILCERHAVYLLPAVAKEYALAYDKARGILRAEAITALPMSEEQCGRMSEKLAQMTGKRVVLRNTVDASVLGGVRLRYAGNQLDSSVRTRLDAMAKSLKEAIL